jgi:hypothetical protein
MTTIKVSGTLYPAEQYYPNEARLLGKLARGAEISYEEGQGWAVTFRALTFAEAERLAEVTKDFA